MTSRCSARAGAPGIALSLCDQSERTHLKAIEQLVVARGEGVYVYDDSNFFPLEISEGWGESSQAAGVQRNFHFTTELHSRFTYEPGQFFSFSGGFMTS